MVIFTPKMVIISKIFKKYPKTLCYVCCQFIGYVWSKFQLSTAHISHPLVIFCIFSDFGLFRGGFRGGKPWILRKKIFYIIFFCPWGIKLQIRGSPKIFMISACYPLSLVICLIYLHGQLMLF